MNLIDSIIITTQSLNILYQAPNEKKAKWKLSEYINDMAEPRD